MSLDPENPEFKKAAALTSRYANRAYVTLQGGMARVAFGESAANVGDTTYHTALTMTPADLLSLADVIYSLIDEVYPPTRTAAETYGSDATGTGGAAYRKTTPSG